MKYYFYRQTKSAKSCALWVKTPPKARSKGWSKTKRLIVASLSKPFCPFCKLYAPKRSPILSRISSRVWDILTRTETVLSHQLNYAICWQVWARECPRKMSRISFMAKKTLLATSIMKCLPKWFCPTKSLFFRKRKFNWPLSISRVFWHDEICFDFCWFWFLFCRKEYWFCWRYFETVFVMRPMKKYRRATLYL